MTSLSKVWIFAIKKPWLWTLKLWGTTITPNLMPLWCIAIGHHVFPMELEVMLYKLWIMFSIIKYVEVVFNEELWFFIIGIRMGVMAISYMHSYVNLITMLMHRLHFILCFKNIFVYKIYHTYHNLCWKTLGITFELPILPSRHKIVPYKVL